MVLPAVMLVPHLYPHAAAFNREGIGSHEREFLRQRILYGINGGKDTYERHDPETDNKNRKDSAQLVRPYGGQSYLQVLSKQNSNYHINPCTAL